MLGRPLLTVTGAHLQGQLGEFSPVPIPAPRSGQG